MTDPVPWSEEELEQLEELALAADPNLPLPDDAVPLDVYLRVAAAPLPDWYMPAVSSRRFTGRRRVVVLSVVSALLVIEAFGLCSTYGQLPFHL